MNSSSVFPFPPSPPSLTHTLNSRGELGMFVNPYTCSCQTCKDYLGGQRDADSERESVPLLVTTENTVSVPRDRFAELTRLQDLYEDRWREAGGGTLRSPSTGATSTTWYLGAMLDEINERRLALGLDKYGGPPSTPSLTRSNACPAWGCTDKNCQSPETTPALPSPPPLSRFLTTTPPFIPPPPPLVRVNAFADCLGRIFEPLPLDEEQERVMESLRSLRGRLQIKRDHTPCDIDNEEAVAAADLSYEDLTSKISAIEQVLMAFRVPFRTG